MAWPTVDVRCPVMAISSIVFSLICDLGTVATSRRCCLVSIDVHPISKRQRERRRVENYGVDCDCLSRVPGHLGKMNEHLGQIRCKHRSV